MKTIDLTQGNITKLLLRFSTPIFFSLLFQTLYNTIDTLIVSHYLGDSALAAMGATTSIFDLSIGLCSGFAVGLSIVVSHYVGKKDLQQVKSTIASSFIITACVALFLSLLLSFLIKDILILLNTPEEILYSSLSYIHVICNTLIISAFYNLVSAILRAVGDSKTPLFILLFSSIVNVVLDLLFIVTLHMGIQGAAIATVIAQLSALLISLLYISKKHSRLIPNKLNFTIQKDMYKELIAQGTSMALMNSIVSVGTITLQSAINGFGTSIIAAHTIARRLQSILIMPISTLVNAIPTFVSQNRGALKYDRIKEGINASLRIVIVYCALLCIVLFFCSETIITLFSGSDNVQVISTANSYIQINAPFYVVVAYLICLRSALQGLGKKVIPLFSSIIELIGKVIFVVLFIPHLGYMGVILCEPIIWVFMSIQLAYAFYTSEEIRNLKKY